MSKEWQCVEVVVVPKLGGTKVDLFNFHQNFAGMLTQLDIKPGECLVPLPAHADLPTEGSKSREEGSFKFYILVYTNKLSAGTWHIG